MQYLELKKTLQNFTVFSLRDIKAVERRFFRARLNEWQDKGYIRKIIKGYYVFSDLELNENVLFEIANRIYAPSYVSFEMALSYYHLIPESVYGITSASTRRTYRFKTPFAEFLYRSIKPSLFFGYQLVGYNGRCFKMASMEKALLDYLYIHPDIKNASDFESLRINRDSFVGRLEEEKLEEYLARFSQRSLKKRVRAFQEFMKHA